MSKCALLYFVIGVTLTTASYAFFSGWTQMPMDIMRGMPQQMIQLSQPQPTPQVCDCRCNGGT